MRQRVGFDPRLESMRGIAALIVAAHHGMCAFNGSNLVTEWLLWPTNPGSAVFFFFVLSGYLLGRALERDTRPLAFLTQRVFRIAPMLVVSVLFAFLCLTTIRPLGGELSISFRSFFITPSFDDLADNILLRGFLVNGPSWSLYPEMVGSVLLAVLIPLHCAIGQRWQWPTFVLVFIALSSFGQTHLGLWFYAGFFLPHRIAPLLTFHPLARWICFAAGFLLIRDLGGGELYKFKVVAPSAIGGVMMIAPIAASAEFLSSLHARSLRFVGSVSYSFYLLHWPIFYLIAITASAIGLNGVVGNITVCTTSIALTLGASAASYHLIELPMIRVGKAFTGRVRSWPKWTSGPIGDSSATRGSPEWYVPISRPPHELPDRR